MMKIYNFIKPLVCVMAVSCFSACSGDKNKTTNTPATAQSEQTDKSAKPSNNKTAETDKTKTEAKKTTEPESKKAASDSVKLKQEDLVAPAAKDSRAETLYNSVSQTANASVEKEIVQARKEAQTDKVKALKTLDEAAKKAPKSFLVPYNKGIIYEWSGKNYEAAQAYESALVIEPNFSPALINLVRLQVSLNNAQNAYNVASNYVASHPNAFNHNLALLEAMIGLGRYDEAVIKARTLLRIDEASAKLRYEIAFAEYSRGRYNLAEFIVKESLELDPKDVDALFLLVRIHSKLAETDSSYASAIAGELDAVLNIQTRHVQALWMRGIIFYQQGDFVKAEKTFRILIDIAPNLPDAYINLANVLKTVNRGPEAEQLLKKAAELSPNNAEVEFAFGTLYLSTEIIEMPGMDNMDRLKMARENFENAASYTRNADEQKLFKGYIRTTDDAIEVLQAMRDAEAFF